MCYVPVHLWLWSPLYPPSNIPPPELHVYKTFSRACISLLLFPPLCPFVVYLPSPPVAPVVTRRPPVRLTGGRYHAAPGVLSSVPMFEGLTPQPVRMVVLGSGVVGGAYETCPPDDLEVLNTFSPYQRKASENPRQKYP